MAFTSYLNYINILDNYKFIMEIKTYSPKSHKIKALIYWPSGSGKTSLWGTAEKVLFASAENWLLSISHKQVAYTEIKSLEDLEELRDFLKNQEHEFETLVIDSITEISDIIRIQIEKKAGRKMQIQDWWELSSKIEGIIKDIKEIDINVLVIAQELNITDEDKIQKIVPSLNGKSSTKICYYMDIVWYIHVDKTGKRHLITNQSDKLLTKDRTGKIWNNTDLDFEVWRRLVNELAVWEEKVLYRTMTAAEIKELKKKEAEEAKKNKEQEEIKAQEEEQEKIFIDYCEKIKIINNLDELRNLFAEIFRTKSSFSEEQFTQLSQLKDDIKFSLEKENKEEIPANKVTTPVNKIVDKNISTKTPEEKEKMLWLYRDIFTTSSRFDELAKFQASIFYDRKVYWFSEEEVNELLAICKEKRQELNEIYGDKEEKLQTPEMQIEEPGESL